MASTHQGASGRTYDFDGPFDSTDALAEQAGVYSILCLSGGSLVVVDVGEFAQVRSRVANHDRSACGRRNCPGRLQVAAYYMPGAGDDQRRSVEKDVRLYYHPKCGDQ